MAEIPTWGRRTLYKGIQMRSRLEATWAAHFDAAGTEWEYEPECFADESGQYLPDFRLRSRHSPFSAEYYEIKGKLDPPEVSYWQVRMAIIWSSEPRAGLFLMVGQPDDHVGWMGQALVIGGGSWDYLGWEDPPKPSPPPPDPDPEKLAETLARIDRRPSIGAILRSRERGL
jgi:hypothetical protein